MFFGAAGGRAVGGPSSAYVFAPSPGAGTHRQATRCGELLLQRTRCDNAVLLPCLGVKAMTRIMKSFWLIPILTLAACFSASSPLRIHPELPTLSYCEVIARPAELDGQLVRVRATYLSGFEQSELSADGCDHRAWTEFSRDYAANTAERVRQLFESLDGPFEIVAVARFTGVKPTREVFGRVIHQGFGHLGGSDFKMEILAIESVRITHRPRR
jgi:hypothetical protein